MNKFKVGDKVQYKKTKAEHKNVYEITYVFGSGMYYDLKSDKRSISWVDEDKLELAVTDKFKKGDRVKYISSPLIGKEEIIEKRSKYSKTGWEFDNGSWDEEYRLELVTKVKKTEEFYILDANHGELFLDGDNFSSEKEAHDALKARMDDADDYDDYDDHEFLIVKVVKRYNAVKQSKYSLEEV